MQKNFLKYFLLFVVLVIVFYFLRKSVFQKSTPTTSQVETTENQELPENFVEFYNKFYSDSTYQMNHILFPLNGYAESNDSVRQMQAKTWTVDDWKIHRPFNDMNGTFERYFAVDGNVISEFHESTNGMFIAEKRFTPIRNEYQLIYYQDLAMVAR